MKVGKAVKGILILGLTVVAVGCASNYQLDANSELLRTKNASKTATVYNIGVDDTVRINVWRNPELSVTVPVRPDGKISMPLIGDVNAAGYAPEQVAKNITNQLQNYVRNPNVTVMVTGLQSHAYLTRIRVTGAVRNSNSINYRQGMTVLDAVLAAGGINEFAAPNRTKLYRKIEGKTRVIDIELGDVLYEGKLGTNLELRPGDIITVPERLF